ncbi:MAG: 50S ribosomal protein L25/general stress protein Ctc [Hyphomicrobiaceae bacterium]|nr:50S ribosomal protein L25/general stress protein Ctc [Hyphomicrobiaceae bacterium]
MADCGVQELQADVRTKAGKGGSRAIRRSGLVPAVIYGNNQLPIMIALKSNEVTRLLGRGTFLSQVFDIDLEGKKFRALTREVQFEPVRDRPIHVDFQLIGDDGKIRVMVPVDVINEDKSPGIKRGGVLNLVRREVEVFCPANNIPEKLVVDLDGVDIGTSVHISSVEMAAGVSATITDRDFTVLTVAGSSASKSDENLEEDVK